MKKFLKYLFFILISWFIIHETILIYDGLNDEVVQSDFIIILGSKVNEDGTLSLRLKARLNKGLELYNNSIAPQIYVSGGFGQEGHYEGSVMADYLISKGVNAEHILIDNNGNNTHLTATNFVKTIKTDSITVTVVSQYFHISRCKLALTNAGIESVFGVHADFFEKKDLYSCIREFFAYYNYLFLGK